MLSPAYDINPVSPANGLHLNITDNDNSLNYDLAMEVIEFFQLGIAQAREIKEEVLTSVACWQAVASSIGISKGERRQMEAAFNI